MNIHRFFKEHFNESNKKLKKLVCDMETIDQELTKIKLKLSTLEIQLLATKIMYKDVMELRKLLIILHPYLKPVSFM